MSTIVLDALRNAKYNFESFHRNIQEPIYQMALEQLNNGIKALENGMEAYDYIQEEFGGEVKLNK